MNGPEAFVEGLLARIEQGFARLDAALLLDPVLAVQKPAPAEWSVAEIAEHVVLADHHLLLLAGKLARKARERVERGETVPRRAPSAQSLRDLDQLAGQAFRWDAPEHMRPRGMLDLRAARRALAADRARCQVILASLPPGAGVLASARFSPLEKRFDVHQFLALMAVHAERHARQALRVRAELEHPR